MAVHMIVSLLQGEKEAMLLTQMTLHTLLATTTIPTTPTPPPPPVAMPPTFLKAVNAALSPHVRSFMVEFATIVLFSPYPDYV